MTADKHDDELAGFLDRLGREERRELDEARAAPNAPGRAERALEQIMAEDLDPAPARGSRLSPWPLLAAALALVSVGWGLRVWLSDPPRTTPPGTTLGAAIEGLEPAGQVSEPWGTFRFDAELTGELWARIRVYDADDRAAEPVVSGRLRETTWTAPAAERERMAGWSRIEWTVELFTGTSSELSAGPAARARASR